MDEYYDQQYTSEKHFGRIFGLFAGMALFITCLGIIGLTLFESRIRSKEVSIRKVLGAPVLDLIALLSKDFFKVIAYSAIISFPIFYIFSEKWLANYPTRIDVNGWSFVSAIVAVVGVAILIVGSVTLRSANVNPVDNLKTE